MNRREFVKTGLCAAALARFPELFAQAGDELSPLEQELMKETLKLFDAANPLDPKTGKRKYISFGFVTDLHKCKRIKGDDHVRTYWYEGGCTLTVQDPSLRLLGAVAREAKLTRSSTAETSRRRIRRLPSPSRSISRRLPT